MVFDVPTACIGCFDFGNALTIGSRILRMFLRASSNPYHSQYRFPVGIHGSHDRHLPARTALLWDPHPNP